METYIKMRDIFREAADIIDELAGIDDTEETPEIKKQYESIMGRFLMKMMELQALQQ